MQKETLSALMDGEVVSNNVLSSLTNDKAMLKSWQSYHLIRDTLRGDIGEVIHLDIAGRVAAALEYEPIRLAHFTAIADQQVDQHHSIESQPSADKWQKMPFWHKIRPWATQLTQLGVAATVSLVVIVGVQHYNLTKESQQTDSPVLNTLPIGGFASPVSYGVPTEVSGTHMQQLQEQRKRINVMLQDYELQRRLYAEQLHMNDRSNSPEMQTSDALQSGLHQQ